MPQNAVVNPMKTTFWPSPNNSASMRRTCSYWTGWRSWSNTGFSKDTKRASMKTSCARIIQWRLLFVAPGVKSKDNLWVTCEAGQVPVNQS